MALLDHELPEELRTWSGIVGKMLDSNRALAQIRVQNFARNAHQGGRPDKLQLGRILDFVRPRVPFPVRPADDVQPVACVVLEEAGGSAGVLYTWCWWDVSVPWMDSMKTTHCTFPIPIARLDVENCVCGYRHLVSLTAVWHLLPVADAVHVFFRANDTRRWQILGGLGATQADLCPSARSIRARKRAASGNEDSSEAHHTDDTQGEAPNPTLRLNQFMGTPRLFLAALACVVQVKRISREVQDAIFQMVSGLCSSLPATTIRLASVPVNNRAVEGSDLNDCLDELGVKDLWRAKGHYKKEPLISTERGDTICVTWLMRNSAGNDVLVEFCNRLVGDLANFFGDALARTAHTELPSVKLPTDCQESMQKVRAVLKGEDKTFLLFNSLLRRTSGFAMQEVDHTLQDVIYSDAFSAYKRFAARALNAACFSKVRRARALAYRARGKALLKNRFEFDGAAPFPNCQTHTSASNTDKAYPNALYTAKVLSTGGELAGLSAVFIYFDASRVASKEVLLVHIGAGGYQICAPLQVLPDQTSVHAQPQAVQNVMQVLLPVKGGSSSNRPATLNRVPGAPTKSLFYSLVQSLRVVVPFANMTPFLCTYISMPGPDDKREYCPVHGHYYYWNASRHVSQWCLPPELRHAAADSCTAKILACVADEGSTGWSLFQWQATFMRTIFFRDPAHRLSNTFTNAIKSVRRVLEGVFCLLALHRYRRAPYGTGRFWSSLKETLGLLLASSTHEHPMFDMFFEPIARDHVKSCSRQQAFQLLSGMLTAPLGPLVQLRRWFTLWDAGWGLDSLWHTMLFSMIAEYAMHGVDAWKLAETVVPKISPDDDKNTKNYKLKQQVLVILMEPMNQRILRSILVCFRHLRLHHADFIKRSGCAVDSLKFYLLWAEKRRWDSEVVLPSLRHSISMGSMTYLGFHENVFNVEAPIFSDPTQDSNEATFLLSHVRLAMSMLWQLVTYGAQPQTPPWSFCRLLSEGDKTEVLATLRGFWNVVLALESANTPECKALLEHLHVRRWACFREPMLLLEAGRWHLSSEPGRLATAYLSKLWGAVLNSVALENGFNDLRDNERRGARHTGRSEQVMQALALSSMTSRCHDATNCVQVSPDDVSGRARRYHVANELFRGKDASTNPEDIGVDAAALTSNRSAWPSTGPDTFSMQLLLLHALASCDQEHWGKLWMACLLRSHMLVSAPPRKSVSDGGNAPAEFFYVLGSGPHSVALLKLHPVLVSADTCYQISAADETAISTASPVTSMHDYHCHAYNLHLVFEDTRPIVCLSPMQTYSMLEYCLRNFVHCLKIETMKKICITLGIAVPKKPTQLTLVETLKDYENIQGDDRRRILELVQAMVDKRRRKKPKDRDVEEEADDTGDQFACEEVNHGLAQNHPMVTSMVEHEVGFLLGDTAAGMALAEEDLAAQATARMTGDIGSGHGENSAMATAEVLSPDVLTSSSSSTSRTESRLDATRAFYGRQPNLDEMQAPTSCTLRKYIVPGRPGKYRWLAKIPHDEGPVEGTYSESSSIVPTLRGNCVPRPSENLLSVVAAVLLLLGPDAAQRRRSI